jgi:hypothetical protein
LLAVGAASALAAPKAFSNRRPVADGGAGACLSDHLQTTGNLQAPRLGSVPPIDHVDE